MLIKDLKRLICILNYGCFAVTFLKSVEEAEQFFQGENNRGMPVGMLDLLKAYHMRFEADNEKHLSQIQAIWSNFILEEDFGNGVFTANHTKKRNRDLLEKYIVPAMMINKGTDLWDGDDSKNINKLKGIIGTPRKDRLVDEKLEALSRQQKQSGLFDLISPVVPGLFFFKSIEQYLKLADAVETVVSNRIKGAVLFQDQYLLSVIAMLCWADRFLKAKTIKNSVDDIINALQSDPEFQYYFSILNRFLNRLSRRQLLHDEKKEVGVYRHVRRDTLNIILQYKDINANLLLLPYRCSTPAQCRRRFIEETSYDSMSIKIIRSDHKKFYLEALDYERSCEG